MKGSWPKVTIAIERKARIVHSLPAAMYGIEADHHHDLTVRAGWTHEVNPYQGCTKPFAEIGEDLDALLAIATAQRLNEVVAPYPPTAEILACWIMANLPAYFMFVEITTDYGLYARSDANTMRSEWAARFRAECAKQFQEN